MNRLILVFLIATFAVTLNAAPGEMIKRSPHMPSMPERPNFPQPGEMPPPPPGLPPPPEGMPRPPMPGLSRFVRSPRMPEIPQPSDIPIPVKRFVRSLEEAPISNLNGMVEPLPEATRNVRSTFLPIPLPEFPDIPFPMPFRFVRSIESPSTPTRDVHDIPKNKHQEKIIIKQQAIYTSFISIENEAHEPAEE